jgi:hypothetical protein
MQAYAHPVHNVMRNRTSGVRRSAGEANMSSDNTSQPSVKYCADGERAAASGPAGPRGGLRGRVLGVARFLPRLHAAGVPGRASTDGQAVLARVPQPDADVRGGVRRGAGGARPSHRRPHPRAQRGPPGVRRRPADVRGDAVFQVGFEHPDWYNGFEHDPEEAARVRVRLLRELASTREPLVATHLSFPSVCHVAVAGDVFRWVPAWWEH